MQGNVAIEELDLSFRTYNCLKRNGLGTISAVLATSEEALLSLRNFGRRNYEELVGKIETYQFLHPSDEGEDFLSSAGTPVTPFRPPARWFAGVALVEPQEDGEP